MISKIGVKINLKIITKNHEADPEIGFLTKSISKRYGNKTAMPPTLESTPIYESENSDKKIIDSEIISF